MASLAASVARLTHPRTQTGRGRPNRSPARVRGDGTVGDDGDEDGVGTTSHCVAVHKETAIAARRHEPIGVEADRRPGAEPARALELDPHAAIGRLARDVVDGPTLCRRGAIAHCADHLCRSQSVSATRSNGDGFRDDIPLRHSHCELLARSWPRPD